MINYIEKRRLQKHFGSRKNPIVEPTENGTLKTYYKYDSKNGRHLVFKENITETEGATAVERRKFVLENSKELDSLTLDSIQRITTPKKITENYLIENFETEERFNAGFASTTFTHTTFDDMNGNVTKETTSYYPALCNSPKQVVIRRSGGCIFYHDGIPYFASIESDQIYYSFNKTGMIYDSKNGYEQSASVLQSISTLRIYKDGRRIFKQTQSESYDFTAKEPTSSYTLPDGTSRSCKSFGNIDQQGTINNSNEIVETARKTFFSIENGADLLANTPAEVYELARIIVEHHNRSLESPDDYIAPDLSECEHLSIFDIEDEAE